MQKLIKNWGFRWVVLSCLIMAPGNFVKAETPPLPKSSAWFEQFYQILTSTGDVANPSNWFIYSSVATYFYYQHFLSKPIKMAEAARDALVKQLAETKISIAEKQKLIAEMDRLILDLKKDVAHAETSLHELIEHCKQLNTVKLRNKKARYETIYDFPRVESWLKSRDGRKYLASEEGKKWKENYDSLKVLPIKPVEDSLKKVIDKANLIIPSGGARVIEAALNPGDLPGMFRAIDPLNYQETQIPVGQLNSHVGRLKAECEGVLSKLVAKRDELTKNSQFLRYWLQSKHIKPSLGHALITASGVGGTLWLHRLYHPGDDRRDEPAPTNPPPATDEKNTQRSHDSKGPDPRKDP